MELNTQNSIKANILYSQYITSVHQEPTLMRKNKCSNINVGNIPCNIFYGEAVFSQWKSNIECWIFIPHLTRFHVSIEIS